MEDVPTLCSCAKELLAALGGEERLRDLLSAGGSSTATVVGYGGSDDGGGSDSEAGASGRVVPHTYNGKQYYAVQVTDGVHAGKGSCMAQRAVVGYHGGDLWCLFCPSGRQRGCDHVQLVQASGEMAGSSGSGTGSSSPWLDIHTAEQRLQEALDLDTGRYKRVCLSSLPLPKHPRGTPLLALLEGQFRAVDEVHGQGTPPQLLCPCQSPTLFARLPLCLTGCG